MSIHQLFCKLMVQIYNLFLNDKTRQDYFLNYFTFYDLCKIVKFFHYFHKTLILLTVSCLFARYLSFSYLLGLCIINEILTLNKKFG